MYSSISTAGSILRLNPCPGSFASLPAGGPTVQDLLPNTALCFPGMERSLSCASLCTPSFKIGSKRLTTNPLLIIASTRGGVGHGLGCLDCVTVVAGSSASSAGCLCLSWGLAAPGPFHERLRCAMKGSLASSVKLFRSVRASMLPAVVNSVTQAAH
jgi:hypothetical protein